MKRLFFSAAAFIALSIPAPIAYGISLTDLPSDTSLRAPIEALVDQGVVSGFGDGTFRPLTPVSWREWAKLVLLSRDRARGVGLAVADPTLSDAATRAVQEGLLSASQPLDVPAPRRDAIAFLARAYGLTAPSGFAGASPFIDAPEQAPSTLAYLITVGVIRGVDASHLGTTTLLRQESAALVWRAMQTQAPSSQNPSIQRSVLRLVSITRTSLTPGDTTSVLFAVDDVTGDATTGLTGADFRMIVLQGSLTVTGFSELGGGVYQYTLQANPQGPPGPIKLRIVAITTVTNQFLDIPGDTLQAGIDLSVSPMSLSQGQTASIIAIPRDPTSERPVSGLTLRAQVVAGSGSITTQMAENPAGSGVYVGAFTPSGVGPATIRVSIDSLVTTPSAEVTIQQIW